MKVRNGNTPIKLPEVVKAGDDITAKWANGIRAALKRLRDRQPVVNGGRPSGKIKRPFWPSYRRSEADPELFEASITIGHVIDRQLKEDPSLRYVKPTGIVDEFDDPIWQSITDGQCIYIRFDCDKKGVIEGEPEMMIGEDDIAHEHWKPEGFQFGGANGEYYYKIAKFVIEDEQPKFEYFHAGENIDHYSERANWKNKEPDVDGELRPIGHIYEEEEDTFWLKTLVQLSGDGKSIILPLPDGETAESLESIQFRRIKQKDYEPQVKVLAEDSDAAITVRGNEYDTEESDVRKFNIEVKDGLVVSLTKVETTGWWGSVSALLGNGDLVYSLGFEDGILVSVSNYGGSVTGTQISPGSVAAVVSG